MTGSPKTAPGRPFGQVLTAMVTPTDNAGAVDLDKAQQLAVRLVDLGHDGLVLNGTTGESPTISDANKADLVRAVADAVGDRAVVVSGAGTYDTAHSIGLAGRMEKAGAHGLLLVTPYYSRPPQAGIRAHFTAIANATELPVMLYDIPVRTGTPLEVSTLCQLAEHPRIVAVKDAKGDLQAGGEVMAHTGLAYYSGDDALNLPWLSVGAVGFVSVIGHVLGDRLRAMLTAFESGDTRAATRIHQGLLPLYRLTTRIGGVVFAKAALAMAGLEVGDPLLPLLPATAEQIHEIATALRATGLEVSAK